MRKRHAKKRHGGVNWLFIVCLLVVIGGSGYLIKTFFFTRDSQVSQESKVVLEEDRRSDNYANLTKEIVAPDSGELDQKIQETNYIGSALIIKDDQVLVKDMALPILKSNKPTRQTQGFRLAQFKNLLPQP